MRLKPGKSLLVAAVLALTLSSARTQGQNAYAAPSLTATQIVARIQQRDQFRKRALLRYDSLRHYQVQYRGLFGKIAAQMAVDVSYDAANGKSFRIVSQSGPKFLVNDVLKRAISSEQEAEKDPAATALSPANYRFQLLGSDSIDGHPAYTLQVDPIKPGKFLYKGKIWVDATDFAVEKIEAEPARNPSFWIEHTAIHYISTKNDGFWLPQSNRSETRVRIGGMAVFTIDYGTYTIPQPAPSHTAVTATAAP